MATYSDKTVLVSQDNSLEDSFEFVEEEVDDVKGIVCADFVPLNSDGIVLQKGDGVIVTEQSLDGAAFFVTNQRTGESGKVPVDYIDIIADGLDESSLDNSQRPKRGGGIIRRSHVSKDKGSPFMHAENDSDTTPLIMSLPAPHDGSPQSSPQLNPASSTPSVASPQSQGASAISQSCFVPRENDEGTVPVERHRTHTREKRNLVIRMPEVPPEYRIVEKYNIVSVSGADRDGRPVIVFSACRLPPSYLINHQRLLEYLMLTLDRYVEQDYTLLYFHHGFSSINKPSFSWLHQCYKELDRKYKKNLKKLYIVHPSNFIRVLMVLFKPLISYKFGRKVTYINRLEELQPVLYLDQIDVPKEVKKYDASLRTTVRSVAMSDSRSVFHVVPSGGREHVSTDVLATKQFGVPIEVLRARNNDDPIPLVLRLCVDHLMNHLEIVGIFRRAPNNALVRHLKQNFDAGVAVSFEEEYQDPHLAAVLIKLFLRELPEPLLTFDAYPLVKEIGGKSREIKLDVCHKVISALPQTNYAVLKYLLSFLTKVVEKEEVNKMSSMNLAIVFGPNLIWSPNEVSSLTSLGEINTFAVILIQHFANIFEQ